MDLKQLNEKSADLLDRLADRLPADRLAQYREYRFVGEWGMFADNLAARLVKAKVPVTAAERDVLREILHSFSLPSPDHRFIENRDEVLASLTIAEERPEP